MNLSRCVVRKIGSPVPMVCGSVANVEKRLADHCDNRWLTELEFSSRPNAKRKLHLRPTKYNLAKLTPLRFGRCLSHNDAWLVAGRIFKRDVNVAVCIAFCANDATSERVPFLFSGDTP
jgi:hypothetical protein